MYGDFVPIVPQFLSVLVIVIFVTDVERSMDWASIGILPVDYYKFIRFKFLKMSLKYYRSGINNLLMYKSQFSEFTASSNVIVII